MTAATLDDLINQVLVHVLANYESGSVLLAHLVDSDQVDDHVELVEPHLPMDSMLDDLEANPERWADVCLPMWIVIREQTIERVPISFSVGADDIFLIYGGTIIAGDPLPLGLPKIAATMGPAMAELVARMQRILHAIRAAHTDRETP